MIERQIFLSLREFAKEELEAKKAKKVEILRIKNEGNTTLQNLTYNDQE